MRRPIAPSRERRHAPDFRLTNLQRIDASRHLLGSGMGLPAQRVVLITRDGLRRRGWTGSRPAGWWRPGGR